MLSRRFPNALALVFSKLFFHAFYSFFHLVNLHCRAFLRLVLPTLTATLVACGGGQDNPTAANSAALSPAAALALRAGNMAGEGSVDGTGAAARFNNPFGIATDSAGNVYVTDSNNHTIRRITAAGVVSTLAGAAPNPGNADGAGALAGFNNPFGIAADSAGNVYAADTVNSTIRKITAAGVVTTVVGAAGQGAFVPGALPGLIPFPKAVTISGSTLYIAMSNGGAVIGLQHLLLWTQRKGNGS
jgi:hypothetical protein